MKKGADTIGNTIGNAIDNATSQPVTDESEVGAFTNAQYTYDQDVENLVWQAEHGVVAQFWVSKQKLYPNAHSVKTHGADAWAATNCYNNNGAIQIWMVNPFEFHLLCKENNGTIRDLILGRENANSNEYFFKNAFTPKQGVLKDIIYWLKQGKGAQDIKPLVDIIISVDGAIP